MLHCTWYLLLDTKSLEACNDDQNAFLASMAPANVANAFGGCGIALCS